MFLALIVVAVIVLIATRQPPPDQPETEPAATPSVDTEPIPNSTATEPVWTPPPETTQVAIADNDLSICGLGQVVLEGSVTAAPETTWAYIGDAAYPTSPRFGPGLTHETTGMVSCFEHSPTGALFAATAWLIFPERLDDPAGAWEIFLADRADREETLKILRAAAPNLDRTTPVHVRLTGFRMLEYTGATARVDLVFSITINGTTTTTKYVLELIWQDGDWKLDLGPDLYIASMEIPTTIGYVPWGEGLLVH